MALLIDCHSMPSSSSGGAGDQSAWRDDKGKADFVLGDRYGTSCSRVFMDAAEYELRRFGYVVERNKPYAGGFITEHYGRPGAGCHALQIEINRALYMDERSFAPVPGFEQLANQLQQVVAALVGVANSTRGTDRIAAE